MFGGAEQRPFIFFSSWRASRIKPFIRGEGGRLFIYFFYVLAAACDEVAGGAARGGTKKVGVGFFTANEDAADADDDDDVGSIEDAAVCSTARPPVLAADAIEDPRGPKYWWRLSFGPVKEWSERCGLGGK